MLLVTVRGGSGARRGGSGDGGWRTFFSEAERVLPDGSR